MNKYNALLSVLLASLACNLLIGGLWLGKTLRQPEPPPPMAWAMREVDQQTYSRMRPLLREQMTEVRPLRAQMRAAMRRFAEVVEQQPFDAVAAEQALVVLRDASAQYQQVLHASMLRVLEGLEPAERAAVVRMVMHRGGRSHARESQPPAPRPPAA